MTSGRAHISKCCSCGQPIQQPRTGRTRLYCSDACKTAAHRRRKFADAGGWSEVAAAVDQVEVPHASTDEQLARALLEARGVGFAFVRLGRDARVEFAWRCERVGAAILGALDTYFRETGR